MTNSQQDLDRKVHELLGTPEEARDRVAQSLSKLHDDYGVKIPEATAKAYGLKRSGYKEFVRNLDKKIWNWRYALPIGVVALVVSNILHPLGGTWNVIGDAIGILNLLILVAAFSAIGEMVRFFRGKKVRPDNV